MLAHLTACYTQPLLGTAHKPEPLHRMLEGHLPAQNCPVSLQHPSPCTSQFFPNTNYRRSFHTGHIWITVCFPSCSGAKTIPSHLNCVDFTYENISPTRLSPQPPLLQTCFRLLPIGCVSRGLGPSCSEYQSSQGVLDYTHAVSCPVSGHLLSSAHLCNVTSWQETPTGKRLRF